MSYNLERREYHILRHVRELISINLNWVSRKVYIGVSVFFFSFDIDDINTPNKRMQLLIFRKQTAWTTHFSAANSSPSSHFFLFLSGIANPKAHISYTGHAFIHIRVRREFSSRETAAFLRVVALCSSSFWT